MGLQEAINKELAKCDKKLDEIIHLTSLELEKQDELEYSIRSLTRKAILLFLVGISILTILK